jgi:hypothetical protein
MDLKLYRMIDLIKKKCSAQKPVLSISYFLSYCPLLIFILYFCLSHFSESIKAMDLKLHRMIDLIKKKCIAQEPVLYISYFLSYCPLLIFILYFCPGHFSERIKAIDLKLHRMIDLIKKKCGAQEPVLCISYFYSYCPLLIFILYICPGHFSSSMKAMDMKLHRMIDLV